MLDQAYLGDGLYASYDGYHVWLSTLEGMRVALEPPVCQRLLEYVGTLKQHTPKKDLDFPCD